MKVLKIKFDTDKQLEVFLKKVNLGCPSGYGEKNSETCSSTNIDTCVKCWKNSSMIYEESGWSACIEDGHAGQRNPKLNWKVEENRISELIQNRIKELKNNRTGYMVCGVSCNHAVVAELERLLKEIEDKEI